MPRIYCQRYPQYTIWNRDIKYQFRDGVLDTDEAGAAFIRSRPQWGWLFTDAPVPGGPPNPHLWKVDTPKPLPAVPLRAPENPMDTLLNRMLGWPHLPIYGPTTPPVRSSERHPRTTRLWEGRKRGQRCTRGLNRGGAEGRRRAAAVIEREGGQTKSGFGLVNVTRPS